MANNEVKVKSSSMFQRSQSRFINEASNQPQVLMEGLLSKRIPEGAGVLSNLRNQLGAAQYKRRYCTVVGGQFPTLSIYTKRGAGDALEVIPLDDAMIDILSGNTNTGGSKRLSSSEAQRHRFEITNTKYAKLTGQQQALIFSAETNKEMRLWIKCIYQAKATPTTDGRERLADLRVTDEERDHVMRLTQEYSRTLSGDALRKMQKEINDDEAAEEAAMRDKYRILKEKVVAILHEKYEQEVKGLGKIQFRREENMR